MNYATIQVRTQGSVYFLKLHSPEANNTISNLLIEELSHALISCEGKASVVVIEGLPEVFCFGADFREIQAAAAKGESSIENPEGLYDLWLKLASGPYVSIAHVRGKANAGGIGFVAACDIVLADKTAQFSLSELLFGLFPACVLPFLVRRIGLQRANYMTLMTKPITVEQAHDWGLVDAWEEQSDNLLRMHLLRLKSLNPASVAEYKKYRNSLNRDLESSRSMAVEANRKIFSDPAKIANITKFLDTGILP